MIHCKFNVLTSALREAVKTMHEVFVEDFEAQSEESTAQYRALAKRLDEQNDQIISLKDQLLAQKAETAGYREALETRWTTVRKPTNIIALPDIMNIIKKIIIIT